MLLQAAEALSVAADTAVDFLELTGGNLVRPFRVSQQLTAHGCAGDAARGKLIVHKRRVGQTAHTGDRLIGKLTHLVAVFQEAALTLEIGVVCRRDCILQAGMVGQCYMEAGDTGIYQHRHKDAQLRLQHTGVAVMRLLLTDSQLVVDGQLRQTAADGPDSLDRKTGAAC